MKVIKGNKQINITKSALDKLCSRYEKVHIDLGTGDGRFVYKQAAKNQSTYYIGVDPSRKQLEVYSRKALRGGVDNVLFVVGSFELTPEELLGTANSVSIILPWGTLLQAVVLSRDGDIEKVRSLFKEELAGRKLNIIFGYSQEAEPSEIKRLGLDKLDINYVQNTIVKAFEGGGFKTEVVDEIMKEDLKKIESTWSKKLVFGQKRPLYNLKFVL